MGNQASISLEECEMNLSKLNRGKERVLDTKNAKLVKANLLNAYNMRDQRSLEKFLAPNATFAFKGADACMPLDMFIEQVQMIQESFPDVCVSFDECKEVEPGVVKISNFYSRGSHIGKPFSYGPFPPIAATGKVVEEGPCQFVILVKNGKMTHFEIEMPEGDITGPPGYYTKIGGKVDLSS